ncbi:uncharacterized protein FTJAE_1864 [Fusarium tjaetaba]|uniref:Uncharacterized protein n=1 Tax=Fusarium tjaetaba TaxID=1567544 RepID=A0A8H5S9I3_9HYPO|nr:uncharacterized protein FTJAE_1864 [Fusarium tjaetaba]KAF5647033.1 hypothetical protein FTJAE_1864 [Fusarium tjaetaba]
MAKASFKPPLQPPTTLYQSSLFCQGTNMYPAMYVPRDYNTSTPNWTWTIGNCGPPSTMQSNLLTIRETKQGEPTIEGLPVCVGESVLNLPSPSPAASLQGQIVKRPNKADKSGGMEMCSSAPLTNVSSTHAKQERRTAELSKDSLKHLQEKKDTLEWIISTRDTSTALSPSLPTYSPESSSCSLETMPRHFVPGENLEESRALVMELFRTLSRQDCESSSDELSSAEGSPVHSRYSSTPLTDGTGTSPKSGTTTSISNIERNPKRSLPGRDGSFQEGDGDEPPRKESRQDKNPSSSEAIASLQGRPQMPCPVQEPQKCQGTNATISQLLRSLEERHRIVICQGCCSKVHVPDDGGKADIVRKRHKSQPCELRCIGTTCSGTPSNGAPYHSRTENCPTWRSLPSESEVVFYLDSHQPRREPARPGLLHRPRGADICDALMRDIEERDKGRVCLESELEAAHERNVQLEERQKKKLDSLENIIETLLERLEENKVKVPNSLQKRLHDECPGVFCEPVAKLISKHSQAPPTPSSTLKDGNADLRHPRLSQPVTAIFQPPLFSSVGSGDGYSQPFDIDFGGDSLTNFNYTDEVFVDSSEQLPDDVA